MSQRLEQALRKRFDAEVDIERALRDDYPVGARVSWSYGLGAPRYHGTVETHGYRDRLKVRNETTGRSRWIVASYIRG